MQCKLQHILKLIYSAACSTSIVWSDLKKIANLSSIK